MNRDYAAELDVLDAEVRDLAASIETLKAQHERRSADLRNLRTEANDAEAWKAASKIQRAAAAELPADVREMLADGSWDRWPSSETERPRLLDLRLIRKTDGRHQLTVFGKAARADARRGAEWCGGLG